MNVSVRLPKIFNSLIPLTTCKRDVKYRIPVTIKSKITVFTNLCEFEKVRLKLALLMYQDPNLLIFDEPTNHLDINSLEIIEEVLKAYKGAVLLISHDRYLMESVCNIKMELKDGTVSTY